MDASRGLAGADQGITDVLAFARANSSIDVSVPSGVAQALYKEAYAAYQAGQYDRASQLGTVAADAAHAAHSLLEAGGATEALA